MEYRWHFTGSQRQISRFQQQIARTAPLPSRVAFSEHLSALRLHRSSCCPSIRRYFFFSQFTNTRIFMTRPPLCAALLIGALALIAFTLPGAAHAQSNAGPPANPPGAPPSGGAVVDEIAAVVGDDIILRSEVDGLVAGMLQQRGAQAPSYSKELWMNALNQLINQQLLVEQAQRDTTIRVSDEQVSQALDQRIDQIVRQAGGEEQVEEIYGKSLIQIKEDFRSDFREQLLADQLRSRRMQSIDITPSEVRDWFQQIPNDSLPTLPDVVRLAHIVRYPEPSEEARQDAREIIGSIRDSVLAGVPIEEMARRYSDDPGSAPGGGQIRAALGDLVPEFAAVASRLPIGEISSIFETPFGFHIMRVNERSGGTVDFNHVLIRVDDTKSNDEEVIEYLGAVRDSLVNHPDLPFALMAKRHSEEDASKNNSGRVTDPRSGTRDLVLEALGPSWRRTIRSLEEGEISQPTEVTLLDGQRAYHIVKLQRRVPSHRVSIETDYERIKELALRDKQQRRMQEWLDKLRAETYVEVRIEPEDLTAASM